MTGNNETRAPAAARPPGPLFRAVTEAAVVFLVTLVFFRWTILQWNGFLDFDGHYHHTIAQWMAARREFWLDIPWLPYTVLGERGPDQHWLWHLLLVPFAYFADANQGLIWAAACNGAATAAILAFVMRMLGIPAAPVFAVLAITAAAVMPYRLMMLRAQNIAIIFMVLSVWAIARRRHGTLGLLAFLFMQSYHGAIVLAPIALIGSVLGSVRERRLVLTPLIAVAAGLLLALLVSPWYPGSFEYLFFHVLFKEGGTTSGAYLSSLVGSEWYPPGWRNVLLIAWPAHFTLAGALAALAWRMRGSKDVRPGPDTLLAVGVAAVSLLLYLGSSRFAEYYVPFACLAAGLAARDAWTPVRRERLRAAVLGAWALVAASVGLSSAIRVPVMPADYQAAIGTRLAGIGRPGEVVFNSGWPDFPALLWHADRLRYVNGLDGHYLAYRDPARFAVWISLGAGMVEDPAYAIEAVFGARFAVVFNRHPALAGQLRASERAILLLESRDGWLFEIRPTGTRQ